jgi:hypothetical protein
MSTRKVILVIQSGWVIVCDQNTAAPTKVTNARIIQRWGTSEGLAQLALHGPQPGTTLSEVFDGEVPLPSVIFTLYVAEPEKWTT